MLRSGFTHSARVSEKPQSAADAQLIRAIGIPGLTANIVNTTIGAGIFVIPALLAKSMGASSATAFIVCAVAMALIVTSFAIAGSRVSLTGGLYAYVEVAFGPYIGFLAGALYFLTATLSVSGVVTLFAQSLAVLWPALNSLGGHFLIGLLAFGTLTVINVRGVRVGTAAVGAVTIIKLVPLLFFVGAGLFFVRPSAALAVALPDPKSLGEGVLLLIFAFAGIEVALVPSGEVLAPARTVPRAIYFALGLTTLLYLLIQIVAQGILDGDLGYFTAAPLAEAARRFAGPIASNFLVVGATVSAFGFVASDVLSSPRILFALGRDRFLPNFFTHVHPRFRTPDVAIASYCSLCLILSLISSFQDLAILADVSVLILYLLCCAATLVLMRRDIRADGKPFSFPGAWIVPPIAIAIIVWILAHATRKEFGITGLVLAIASILFLFRRKARATQLGN